MEQKTPTARPVQLAASCSYPRGSRDDGTHAHRVKEMIWPTWCSLPSSLSGLVLRLAHCDWFTRRDRYALGNQKCTQARRCQKVAEEDAGKHPVDAELQLISVVSLGALCTQLL